ncbi:protein HESO1 isoform X1 [Carica papaya]|uniref:protein HESO1 isoform X1 n=2 Tax=Carica papaya TaxID=3649 RepID=UPI000B8CEAFE|nr:protein HESO1 isoform X1 [Carica papaya]XP_021904139.1 protein HESO1 isoform X1 [Carica papaya]
MSVYSVLELMLNDILNVIKPLREDWEIRFQVINQLQEVVGSVDSLRGATVEPFGSFVSNLFTRLGDLDVSVELMNGTCLSSAGKRRKQTLLGELLNALRQKGGFCRVQFIPNARVPILKLESNHRAISCDISIDNLQGQIKSKLLFWISQIDGRFRDMVLLVKEWAKANDINNPKVGTFNSYSLSLLVVFHFQTCVPAIFPPLKDIYPGNVVDDLQGERANAEKLISETCAANIARFLSDKSRAVNRSSLSELFISFLAKFSELSSQALEQGICPFTGRWEDTRSNTRWMPRNYAIFIEDPFEQPENTARAVNAKQLTRISEIFEVSRCKVISPYDHQNALLDTLARPQTARMLGKIPTSNSAHGPPPPAPRFVYSPAQAQLWYQNPKPVQSPSQSQHQFQNVHLSSPALPRYVNVRAVRFPLEQQQQRQFQNKRQVNRHPNNIVAQRPVQQYVSQVNHPNKVIAQRPVQQYTGQVNHPNNVGVQRPVQQHLGQVNDYCPNVGTARRPVQQRYSEGQQIWRQKSGRE